MCIAAVWLFLFVVRAALCAVLLCVLLSIAVMAKRGMLGSTVKERKTVMKKGEEDGDEEVDERVVMVVTAAKQMQRKVTEANEIPAWGTMSAKDPHLANVRLPYVQCNRKRNLLL
jgi:hypothetical protein